MMIKCNLGLKLAPKSNKIKSAPLNLDIHLNPPFQALPEYDMFF